MTEEPTNEECEKFWKEKLRPATVNLCFGLDGEGLPTRTEITPAKLRYIRDEISLFLGDGLAEPEVVK